MDSLDTDAAQSKIFFNTTAATRNSNNILKRPFCFEQGFLFKDKPYMGYDESVSSIVEQHGWDIFCLHPEDVLGRVVREFYAHVKSVDSSFIYVRGTSIPFDEDHINAQFDLKKIQDEYTEFVDNITIEGLTQVLKDLCVKGTQWIISSQECYTVERASLRLIGKVWYHFLKIWLMPSTHNTIISKEMMLLLHSIIERRMVNVGRIIFHLNCPSLITALCKTANVPLTDAEDITLIRGINEGKFFQSLRH
ncbi:hypothetical protein V6Z11_D09G058600 [Gossypium hirsutum]